jgi:hypothetical protein
MTYAKMKSPVYHYYGDRRAGTAEFCCKSSNSTLEDTNWKNQTFIQC